MPIPTPMPLLIILAPPLSVALSLASVYLLKGVTPANIWRTSGTPFKILWSVIVALSLVYLGFELTLRIVWPVHEIAPLVAPAPPPIPNLP